MRMGTWNLDHSRGQQLRERHRALLAEVDADIWVLTETVDEVRPGASHVAVHSAPRPDEAENERWVSIWSRYPIVDQIAVADPSRTVAALLATPVGQLLVFGTVLPWQHDRGPGGDAPGWSEHHRVIPLQGAEWADLVARHPDVPLCVAGDFNTDLGGRHYYGTRKGRDLLGEALAVADLVCVTGTSRIPDGLLQQPPIDHICLSRHLAEQATVDRAWEGRTAEGVRLSDHSGLVIGVGAG